MGHGYKKNCRLELYSVLYPRPLRWWNKFLLYYICHLTMGLTRCYKTAVFYRAACNATHVIAVAILSVCSSSVRRVYCDKIKWWIAGILVPHEMAITLVLWHQHSLVGDAPFFLKSALKVTHLFEKRRLRQISAHNISAVRDSKKVQLWRIYRVGQKSNRPRRIRLLRNPTTPSTSPTSRVRNYVNWKTAISVEWVPVRWL